MYGTAEAVPFQIIAAMRVLQKAEKSSPRATILWIALLE
jgi:hypothetical protein